MSRIRANQFTDKAGTGAPTFPNGVQVTGVSTLGNTVVGGGTTQLVVTGNARITGILTIGTSSITLDGSSNQVNVGTGVTLHHTNGVQVGGNTLHSTVLTVNNINASGVVTATSFSGSGANLTGIGGTTDVRTNSLVVSGVSTVTTLNATSIVGITSINDGPLAGTRNRIINGDMRIDQRNAGASVTPTSSDYTLDRWRAGLSVASKFSVQQSSTVPTGFNKSLLVTSLSAYSPAVSDEQFTISQRVEGFNTADLDWGSANAKSITLSFWTRSSLTGTFGGSLRNNSLNRSYPFTYSISSANTWEQKTLTISGDTSGTWDTTTSIGILVNFDLGSGSDNKGTAGAWAGANYTSATGATSVVGTNGATWYITGVQLEAGSVATPFERRSFGQELALCQRYFENVTGSIRAGQYGGYIGATAPFKATKRAAPTCTFVSLGNNLGVSFHAFVGSFVSGMDLEGCFPQWTSASGGYDYGYKITASAEL